GGDRLVSGSMSYTGVASLGAVASFQAVGNSISGSLTTTQANSWIAIQAGQSFGGAVFTPAGSVVQRWTRSAGNAHKDITGVGADLAAGAIASYPVSFTINQI